MEREPVGREELWALCATLFLLVVTASWWALALWPAGSSSPAWLARTQAVCFGVSESGLPDAGGWVALIGSPLGIFAVLFVSARAPLTRLLKRLRDVRWLQVTAAAVAVFVMGSAHFAGVRISSASEPDEEELVVSALGSAVKLNRPVPELRLIDQTGEPRDIREYEGRPLVVTFAYAHCETVCPVLVRNALDAQKQLEADDSKPVVLIVTLDPLRDTPSRLPAMAQSWKVGADAFVLSGDTAVVRKTLDDWNVARSYNPADGMVTHPALAYVVNREQRIEYETMAATPQFLVSLLEEMK